MTVSPDGFFFFIVMIVEQCPLPDVADRTELTKLVGQKILYAFDDEQYGWYIGTIAGTSLGARDLKQTPRANCVISYRRKETIKVPPTSCSSRDRRVQHSEN